MANETCSYECKPHIGADGYWYVGAEFTGVRASGNDGITPNIGADGYWYIWDKNMGVKAVGEQGVKGEKGEKGNQGDQGPTGATGPQGPAGQQGATGSQGPTGATGPQGPAGQQGATGSQGPNGATGTQGNPGPKGDPGAKGEVGAVGSQGIRGLQGVKGDKGESGAIGPIGPQGIPGPVNIANDLTTEFEGYALDARQGKVLEQHMKSVGSSLSEIAFEYGSNDKGSYKKYNNGLLEMRGTLTIPAMTNTNIQSGIAFPMNFSDTSYGVFITPYYNGNIVTSFWEGDSSGNSYRTLSGCMMAFCKSAANYGVKFSWYAVGSWK